MLKQVEKTGHPSFFVFGFLIITIFSKKGQNRKTIIRILQTATCITINIVSMGDILFFFFIWCT